MKVQACGSENKKPPFSEAANIGGYEEWSEIWAARFIGRGLVTIGARNATEVIEKFADYVQVTIPAPGLAQVKSLGEVDCFYQWSPNVHRSAQARARNRQTVGSQPSARARQTK